jgi:3-oxoacyl-[acyl-carrier-protein] synthase II
MTRRVVVTGIGALSPLGLTAEETWRSLIAGQSGIDFITSFDTELYNVKVAGEIKNWDPEQYMHAKEARRRSRYQQFVVAAAREALAQSGLTITDENRHRTSVIIGSSVGGYGSYYQECEIIFRTGDPRKITPFGIPMLMVNGGSDLIAIELGATGQSFTPVSACATGADCIGLAYDLIRIGRIDQAVAGGSEAPVFNIGIAAFDRTGACSRESEVPARACRPFNKDRPGLVFSEGAGVLVLEALESAEARGAIILGELVGYASTSDAFHITAPHPEGLGASMAIQAALEDARLRPEQIDYINAHGTGTDLNDVMETKAVKRVFGEHAYQIPMSSTKSMTGHAMGATAAMEAVFCLLALRDGIMPPTINLDEPDPECDLDYVPQQARERPLKRVMSNSFGFGGHNVSLIFSVFEG